MFNLSQHQQSELAEGYRYCTRFLLVICREGLEESRLPEITDTDEETERSPTQGPAV